MDEQPVDWLDDEEMRAWRGLVEVYADVHASLEAELLAGFGFREGDYAVLVNLSEAPERRLRMCDLADPAAPVAERAHPAARRPGARRAWSPGSPAPPTGGSPWRCSPTPGYAALDAAAPVHVDGVRRHFLAHLDPRAGPPARRRVRRVGRRRALRDDGGCRHRPPVASPPW